MPPRPLTQQKTPIHKIVPELSHMTVEIASLTFDPNNARKHPDVNKESIQQSLDNYGQLKPIVVRKSNRVILAGNGTVAAAKNLGWTHIAATLIDISDNDATAFALTDNRTAELATWDYEVVTRQNKMLMDVGHRVPGYTDDELEILFAAEWIPPPVEEDENPPHVSRNTGNDEWYTPAVYITSARAVMGGIDLDPASCPQAQQTVKASEYYTIDDDGLEKQWAGRVWMNPPYTTGKVEVFVGKLVEHYTSGDVTEVIVLTNNSTDTEWFHTLMNVSTAICLVKKRIKFLPGDGEQGTPLQGQVFAYLGKQIGKFHKEFSKYGIVLLHKQSSEVYNDNQQQTINSAIREIRQYSPDMPESECIAMICREWFDSQTSEEEVITDESELEPSA